MSHGSAWERQTLAVKQVPTLRKLLRCCDEQLLVRTVIEEHVRDAVGTDAPASKRRRAVEKRLAATVATMRKLPLGSKEEPPRFLLPAESFVLHARSGFIERKMSASLVFLDDVPLARRIVGEHGIGSASPDGCQPGASAAALPVRCYTLAPWEDVLAYRVWLGGPWCTRERYLVLASAFWEMTYLGFEHDRVRARQEREKARRMLEGDADRPGEQAQAVGGEAQAAADGSVWRATTYGLHEPDRFARDYRDRFAERVGELNASCQRDLCLRFLDLMSRLDDARA